ncbi:MAG: carboxyl-terminal processing protease [Candidatus Kentron sp. G]|nr:MAG: carboxyl-terminal processing protease [Candidatus Kentron sp. G]
MTNNGHNNVYRIRILLILTLTICFPIPSALAIVQPGSHAPLAPEPRHARITELVVQLVGGYHYRKTALDDALSASVLEHYFRSLDPNRSFFLDKDIKGAMSRYGHRLDDALRDADITPAFEIFERYKERVQARIHTALYLVEGERSKRNPAKGIFDFTVDEDYIPDRAELPWAKHVSELDEIWRKRIKNDFLVLRLEGEKDDDAIRETLRKRYETTLRHVEQFTADDVCQLFINAYAASIGPHTSYLSPRNSENLFIHLSLSLEGIGAVLQSDNEYTMIRKIIAGGPADKDGKLQADDVIIGVGQGSRGEIVDVIGWRLQDVVNLIRGPKGSVVRLKILPGGSGRDGKGKVILLIRNRIDLVERAAKSSVIDVPSQEGTLPIGIIELPTFYAQVRPSSGESGEKRTTTRDVQRLIDELKETPVEGIVLDLRGNSGGSLEEAISLTGLFLESGPVVQIKKSDGKFAVKRDKKSGMAWPGPLAVLVDRASASASEIFAGAIQDYGRGLIVGETTHGKGTVQHLINLDNVARSNIARLGQLKLTIAQFFRVNGESTQYRGVIPDIVLPNVTDPDEEGERALDNALPWDAISPVKFSSYASSPDSAVAAIHANHDRRMTRDPVFGILRQELAARKKARAKTRFSLLESQRRRQRKSREQDGKAREEQLRMAMGLKEEPGAGKENDPKENKPNTLVSEVLLRETANIVADMISFRHRSTALVTDDRGLRA